MSRTVARRDKKRLGLSIAARSPLDLPAKSGDERWRHRYRGVPFDVEVVVGEKPATEMQETHLENTAETREPGVSEHCSRLSPSSAKKLLRDSGCQEFGDGNALE
jgi:hypothetical protein